MDKIYNVSFKDSVTLYGHYPIAETNTNDRWKIAEMLYNKNYLGLKEHSTEYKIPKIIHQVWLGSPFPEKYKQWQKTWIEKHPGWEYMLWTDDNVKDLNLVNQELFDKTENYGPKVDILRYELLNKFGGIYADTDFECIKPFDFFHKNFDFFIGIMTPGCGLNGALMGSAPAHPIIEKAIKDVSVPKYITQNTYFDKTGPGFITKCFYEKFQESSFTNIAMPSSFFYPFPGEKRHIIDKEYIYSFFKPESYAVHYWEVSWAKATLLGRIIAKILPFKIRKILYSLYDKIINA